MPPKRRRLSTTAQMEYEVDSSNENYDDIIMLPNPDDSGDDSDFEDEVDDDSEFEELQKIFYRNVSKTYTEDQSKLEKDHSYKWNEGERVYQPDAVQDAVLLAEDVKKRIQNSEPVELFEKFFSEEIKNYIVEATKENGYNLTLTDLNAFIGIVILTSFNKRKSQRDYWSTDPYLSCEVVSSVMGRNKFEKIKSSLKYAKRADENRNDKAWRVRVLLDMFQINIQQFGFWRNALSVDEMMVKSYARTSLKQFIRGKPIRFGLKFWGLCTVDGYLLNLDLYCGKNSKVGESLTKCALGTRVVMNLLKPLLETTVPEKLTQYHVYFDNYFTSFDLLLHLKKMGVRCTGTIRENRVTEKNIIDKKSARGTFAVKNDENSGINYISVMDSKQVSIASTAAGVTPLSPLKRYSSEEHRKMEILFPYVFGLYNKLMGGVDLQDNHCNNLLPSIRSKKWTWVVFLRLIQTAIVNAVVIFNAANEDQKTKKVGTKDFAISIAKYYMKKGELNRTDCRTPHVSSVQKKQEKCFEKNCPIRTNKFCNACKQYYCKTCFQKNHP